MKEKKTAREKAALARRVARKLRASLGAPEPPPRRPVLDELILTILSQNTNDRNRNRAFNNLKARFRSWEDVLGTRRITLEKTIAPAGLAPTKSRHIWKILETVYRDRSFDPSALCRMPTEDARSLLLSFDGVGPKTAACVLAFSCGAAVFPVDTHIHRVCKRLGLIGSGVGREKAHAELESLFPEKDFLEVHLNIIRLGRTVCRPTRPNCTTCPLLSICVTGDLNPSPARGSRQAADSGIFPSTAKNSR